MIKAYNEGINKYNTENGHFRTSEKMNDAQIQSVEENAIRIYNNFYLEQDLTNGSTMRIFANREQVNLACLMEGEFPKAANEIAIDRMYADNNKISIGDTLKSDTQSWKVTGFIALPDYSCLFQNNNDSMFDSVKFGIGVVTSEAFESLDSPLVKYCYAWKYNDEPTTEKEEKEVSDDLMKAINKEVSLEEFVPRYLNQAIIFTRDDMGSDRAMMIVFLYIVIAIMAFVFGITISNTIAKEANVIGTLLASGYTRNELIRHYMAMPILVTLVGALIGNVLGYTIMKDICVGMYYGSYSLPTYVTVWNAEAFLLTTIIPILLMLLVNYTVLRRRLSLSPLKFLRRDLKRRQQKHALSLSRRIPFFSRFRLRVIFQNVSNYLLLFLGILFANLLLMFGLLFPAVLDHYQTVLEDNLLGETQMNGNYLGKEAPAIHLTDETGNTITEIKEGTDVYLSCEDLAYLQTVADEAKLYVNGDYQELSNTKYTLTENGLLLQLDADVFRLENGSNTLVIKLDGYQDNTVSVPVVKDKKDVRLSVNDGLKVGYAVILTNDADESGDIWKYITKVSLKKPDGTVKNILPDGQENIWEKVGYSISEEQENQLILGKDLFDKDGEYEVTIEAAYY